jgi:hypothetical protein
VREKRGTGMREKARVNVRFVLKYIEGDTEN